MDIHAWFKMTLLNVNQLANKIGVKPQTVFKWVREGCPTVVNKSRMKRFDLQQVIDWLNSKEK